MSNSNWYQSILLSINFNTNFAHHNFNCSAVFTWIFPNKAGFYKYNHFHQHLAHCVLFLPFMLVDFSQGFGTFNLQYNLIWNSGMQSSEGPWNKPYHAHEEDHLSILLDKLNHQQDDATDHRTTHHRIFRSLRKHQYRYDL